MEKKTQMLKIKQSVRTLVSVAPRSVVLREHCTWSFRGRSPTLESPPVSRTGLLRDPPGLESFLGSSAILSHKYA